MKQWKGSILGALTVLLVAAPFAEAAAPYAMPAAQTDEAQRQAVRDAERAAKAAERAQRQAERAAAHAQRMNARAQEKADAAAAREKAPSAPPAAQTKPVAEETPAHGSAVESTPVSDAPAAAPSAVPAVSAREAARAEKKAARAAAVQERRDAVAAAKAEKRAAVAKARLEKRERARRDRGSRYKTLFTDGGFIYDLDVRNTRWVLRPYSSEEYMIDAWVRLVENTPGETVAEDGKTRPAKYFLEHYYISPQRHQIMFLAELEVSGRPENAVQERAYDPSRWENLIPGSIEDDLYEVITARMKSAPGQRGGLLSGTSGMSLRDVVEEFARISF